MARLVIHDGSSSRTVELTDATTVAGRSSDNKLHIEDKQASRKHFQVEKTEFGYKVVDLESRNGTRVNDRVVNQALLRPGDRIQVGKHTLTFEDPSFKEPPADVAARFAPPAQPAPAVEKPPADALDPDPTMPAGGPETRIRRRTGATTSIERVHRIEAAKEKKLVTYVGVGAGVFVFILLVLVLLPSGSGESPASVAARETFTKAQGLVKQGKYDDAELLLGRIGADQKQWYTQAQGLTREIQATRARNETAKSEGEKKAFDEIYDFGEKKRGDPTAAAALAAKCEAFKRDYPKSASLSKVDEYLAEANKARKAARGGDIAEAERASQESVKRNDYATGLKLIIGIREKYKDDLDLSERLLKVHDEVIEKAKAYTNKRVAEANDLAARNKVPDAIKILEEIVTQMGDGTIEALGDYALRARTTLQGLK
ncbi:MAG TPA: FHA domain-containing protein [Planctomycetota bacterium]